LKQELDKLAELQDDLERDDQTAWEVLSNRQTMLHLEMSHEELVQMTSIANALNAMQLDSVAELVGLKRQIDALFNEVHDLQVWQEAEQIKSGPDPFIEVDQKPEPTSDRILRKAFDFSGTPHKG